MTGAPAARASARPKATASSERSEPSTPMRILDKSLPSLPLDFRHGDPGLPRILASARGGDHRVEGAPALPEHPMRRRRPVSLEGYRRAMATMMGTAATAV